MLEGFYALHELHVCAEFCLTFLEDRLQDVCNRSRTLSALLLLHAGVRQLDASEVWVLVCDVLSVIEISHVLGIDTADVPLLVAVAATHTPNIHELVNLDF
jgi:hypothetical protein